MWPAHLAAITTESELAFFGQAAWGLLRGLSARCCAPNIHTGVRRGGCLRHDQHFKALGVGKGGIRTENLSRVHDPTDKGAEEGGLRQRRVNLMKNNVYILLPSTSAPSRHKIIGSRWILNNTTADDSKKERIVVFRLG